MGTCSEDIGTTSENNCGDVVTTGDAEVWLRGDVMPRP